MVDRAYRLSSNWLFFSDECDCLRRVFHTLTYPKPLVETTIKRFFERMISSQEPCPSPDVPLETVRVVLPFKDQSSANYFKQQLNNLSSKLNVTVQPVFVSPKLEQQLKGRFTRYDFVAYDKLTTGLRHELFRVNQTYNSLNGPKSCRRPVVSLLYATKSNCVNRP